MYSLDVNFLKDRGLDTAAKTDTPTQKPKKSIISQLPIFVGLIIAIVAPALTFGYLKQIEGQKTEAEKDIESIDSEIGSIGGQNQQIDEIKAQIQQLDQETKALVGVFEKIKPWSAILQEISDRTPPGVQIDSLQQNGSGTNTQLLISGTARSYNDINDFVLFLQRSQFINGQNTKLNNANLANFSVEIENQDVISEEFSLTVPEGVKYSITAQLSNTPASKLIRELDSKGSLGLTTRLKTLERKGAI
jgi:type IV pilus assembly protein PilN